MKALNMGVVLVHGASYKPITDTCIHTVYYLSLPIIEDVAFDILLLH